MRIILILSLLIFQKSYSFENPQVSFANFSLNKYEITIQEFKKYAIENNITTEAEKTGGGYE